jgi:hypothetical protein
VNAVLAEFSNFLARRIDLLVHANQIWHEYLLHVANRAVIEIYFPVFYLADLVYYHTCLWQKNAQKIVIVFVLADLQNGDMHEIQT